jgi:hypothetical protein
MADISLVTDFFGEYHTDSHQHGLASPCHHTYKKHRFPRIGCLILHLPAMTPTAIKKNSAALCYQVPHTTGKRLKRSLNGLSHRRDKSEVSQHGHHIVVDV